VDPHPDWRVLNVLDLARASRHHLPPIYDRPLDEAPPDSLAFLLASAVMSEGARAEFLRYAGNVLEIDVLTRRKSDHFDPLEGRQLS